MDKKMETTILGDIGTSLGIHSFKEMLQGHRSCWA